VRGTGIGLSRAPRPEPELPSRTFLVHKFSAKKAVLLPTADLFSERDVRERLSLTTVTDEDTLSLLKDEWNGLLSQSRSDTVFLTWEWLEAWWQCFRHQEELWLLLIKSPQGQLVGIAPFCRVRERAFGRRALKCVRFIGDRFAGSEYLDFIIRQGWEERVLEAIFQYLAKRQGYWDILRLNLLPATSVARPFLARWSENARHRLRAESIVCSSVPLPGTWDSYLKTLRPRFRTSLRSKTRNLNQDHEVTVLQSSDPEQLPTHLDVLFRLHQARWAEAGKPGSFKVDAKRKFYRLVGQRFCGKGWLRFYLLRVDGAMVAAQFGFAYNKVFFHLQEGTCLDNPAWSVGNVLRGHVIKQLIDQGFTEYDFLGGITFHKENWGAVPKYAFKIIIAKPGLVTLLAAIPYWKKRARRIIKSLFMGNGRSTEKGDSPPFEKRLSHSCPK
jgi:CelD/BcsL family acetyltransferase involved in cellulose biosynthesis